MLGTLPCRVVIAAAFTMSAVAAAAAAPPVAPSPPWFASVRADLPPRLADLASRRAWLEPQGLAAFPFDATGTPDSLDAHWRPGFGLPVPDREINSLLVSGGVLVAGGGFRRIGDLDVPGLAAWDGASWSRIGRFPGHYVQDLAPYRDGFVAIAVSYGATVWHWTGSTWETWYDPSGYAYAEALAAEDTLVAVATVVNTGSESRSRVHLHTPSGWTTLGGDFDDQVTALAWYGGSLYAAGWFDHAGGEETPRIARWDGTHWQPLAQQLSLGPYDGVSSLAVYRGELVAAGPFGYRLDPSQPRFIARWDGSRWAPLGSGGPQDPTILRLRVVGPDLYALGVYSWGPTGHAMSRWDGSTWHLDEERFQLFVDDVALFQGDLYAGGALSRNGPDAASAFMRRHEGTWRAPVPGTGMQGLLGWDGPQVQALAVTDRGIVAAGRIDLAGASGAWRLCPGIALWDGSEWTPLGLEGSVFLEPYDLVVHQGVLHAIGSFGEQGSVAKFTDEGWTPLSGAPLNPNRGLSALGDLYVAGSVDPNDAFHGIARWDGASWVPLGAGVTRGAFITSMAQLGSELIVAGMFQEVGGVPCENVAAWNPRRGWHALGAGLVGTVSDLTARDGVLYAAGSCGLSTGAGPPWGIVRWRARGWENVGSCPCAADRLGWYRGRLVASRSGGLAMLDPDGSWRRLGSGTNGPVTDMVESGPSLFVAGMFSRAGSTSAYGFAEWRDDSLLDLEDPAGPQVAPAISPSPNPSTAAVNLRYVLPAASRARVEVFDLTGHRVDLVFEGLQSAGAQDVIWHPDAARVRAGVYFARLTVGASDRVVRVLRIP